MGEMDKQAQAAGAAPTAAQQKAAAFDTTAPAYPPTVQGYPVQGQGYGQQPQQHWQQSQQQPQQQAQQPAPYTTPAYAGAPAYGQNYNGNSLTQDQYGNQHCGNGCFNIQWALFIAGWFCIFTSWVAIFLPFFSRGRLAADPSYRSGWIANIVLSTLWVLAIIFTSIFVNRRYNGSYNNSGYVYYG